MKEQNMFKSIASFGQSPLLKRLIHVSLILSALWLTGCDYGNVGGADTSDTVDDSTSIERFLESWQGEWYSHYGNRRLDSYRVGKWKDRETLLPPVKQAHFPGFDINNPAFRGAPAVIGDDDYFVFYDDTVYETAPGSGGNGGWGFGYMGIVRAINLFNGTSDNGAIIIEYLDGCYPGWEPDLLGPPPLPFFGIFFRILEPDCIQMANAVNLENLYAGRKYYTETATLQEAIDKNNAENEGEFIAWGVVIPQDRE
jgi:hypothetical protein